MRVQDIRWMSVLHRPKRSGDIENLRGIELTEFFRMRDASCPKGKKIQFRNIKNGKCKEE